VKKQEIKVGSTYMGLGLLLLGNAFQDISHQTAGIDISNTKFIVGTLLTCFGLWPIMSVLESKLPK